MMLRSLISIIWLSFVFTACQGITTSLPGQESSETNPADDCPVTEPVWEIPPEDTAVQNKPEYGDYFVNEDGSIWASAWWIKDNEYQLKAGEEGIKVGWFRPAGSPLTIAGRRLDAQAPPLEVDIPCCYPTRFQATGLYFPVPGCWEVTAKAGDRELSFVVYVEP